MRKFSLFIFDLAYFLFLLYNLQIIKTMCMWYHVINPRSDTCHLSPLVYLLPKTFKLFGIPIFFTKGVPDEGYYRNVPFTLLKISRIIFGIKFFSLVEQFMSKSLFRVCSITDLYLVVSIETKHHSNFPIRRIEQIMKDMIWLVIIALIFENPEKIVAHSFPSYK
jgi:hypothetical protein